MPSITNSKEEFSKHINNHITETTNILKTVTSDLYSTIYEIVNTIINIYDSGGKLLIAGNGGSAADAQHFAAEMVVRLNSNINRKSLAAISLTTDTSILTATANDFGFNQIFKRQLEGLATKNDLFIAISTSGNSENLVEALKYTKANNVKSIGLLGCNGGKMKPLVDIPIVVKSNNTMHIQEAHICIYHLICDLVERTMF